MLYHNHTARHLTKNLRPNKIKSLQIIQNFRKNFQKIFARRLFCL